MCGIIGYIGNENAVEEVYEGLKRLEYRGYDSAGAAFFSGGGIKVIKRQGKVEKLLPLLNGLSSRAGIGHTRWATHGKPSDINSHPHSAGEISIVHNGIIENYAELKEKLSAWEEYGASEVKEKLVSEGAVFVSETDSEVIAHLIRKFYRGDLLAAVRDAVKLLKGSYALMAICEGNDSVAAACYKSPLIMGCGKGGYYLRASATK